MPGYVDLGYGIQPSNPRIQPNNPPIQLKNYVSPLPPPAPQPLIVFPQGPTDQRFQHPGIYARSNSLARQYPYLYSLVATAQIPQRVYDSGCFSYENEGIYHFDANGVQHVDVPGGQATNGLDDPVPPPDNLDGTPGQGNPGPDGVVDDIGERINTTPYPVPLRGIQVKTRCFEPDSRQIREITIEHDFLPK